MPCMYSILLYYVYSIIVYIYWIPLKNHLVAKWVNYMPGAFVCACLPIYVAVTGRKWTLFLSLFDHFFEFTCTAVTQSLSLPKSSKLIFSHLHLSARCKWPPILSWGTTSKATKLVLWFFDLYRMMLGTCTSFISILMHSLCCLCSETQLVWFFCLCPSSDSCPTSFLKWSGDPP